MKAKRGMTCSLAALAVLLAVVVVVAQWDLARAAPFNPTATVTVADNTAGANADRTTEFSVPAGNANYDLNISFTPVEFAIGTDVAIGAHVADLNALSTLGLLNQPCTTPLEVSFKMLSASVDTSDTLVFDDTYTDADGNTILDGAEKYPDFLTRMFPGLTPTSRMFGATSAAGTAVTMNFVVFEPGTSIFGVSFDASLGRPSVSVLNNTGDPAVVAAPSAITDFCTPLSATTTNFGMSKDNPDTAADESGKVVSTNPTAAGDYTFTTYATGLRDADDDGIDNYLDACPYNANTGTDADNDGLDSACDPDDSLATSDYDGDGFMNRGDDCALIADPDQKDTDADRIGDACDQNPNDANAEGASAELYLTSTVTITGGAPPAETPTVIAPAETPTAAATPTVVATPTAVATPKATPTAVATPSPALPTGGAGLLGSNGGFPLWAMYVIGVAAALMLGSVGTAASVVWRRRR